MSKNEYLASWLSNISVACGASLMVSVVLMVMDGKVNDANRWLFVIVVCVSAVLWLLFFIVGLAVAARDERKTIGVKPVTPRSVHNEDSMFRLNGLLSPSRVEQGTTFPPAQLEITIEARSVR
ncbi:hypothetical protein [Neorhizobium galegae]|uniref:hypothetical protein n=1 Tax=Neorhizobium galegae TaxID=399 RepID=UPI001F239413|nr:hypothetical protein [Neorhizobium galegae]UIK05017.1 hypothetical protein LZK81_20570 [Neorhizobium galegae]